MDLVKQWVILPSIVSVMRRLVRESLMFMIKKPVLGILQAEQRVLLAAVTCTCELSLIPELPKYKDLSVKHSESCVFDW